MELLQAKGAEISDSDPHVPRFLPMRKHDFDLESVPLTAETLAAADCVLLATDQDRFDYELIKAHAPLIVDTRGRYREAAAHIVRAGLSGLLASARPTPTRLRGGGARCLLGLWCVVGGDQGRAAGCRVRELRPGGG